ncbi:ParE family toxin-like protein [Serratia proteamaculans]
MKPCIPKDIRIKADEILCAYRSGLYKARRTHQHKYLTLPVTPFWRYLSKDNGDNWDLMSHSKYNGELRK